MSTLTPQQLVAAQQAGLNALFGFANTAFAGIEKLVALNVQASKATLAENQEVVMKALSAGNPSELLALPTALSQPAADKVTAYGRQVHEIVSGVQGEFLKSATELFQQSQKDGQAFVESLAKNAPAGSEGTIAAWNTAFSAMNSTYETANKAAKQFVASVSAA